MPGSRDRDIQCFSSIPLAALSADLLVRVAGPRVREESLRYVAVYLLVFSALNVKAAEIEPEYLQAHDHLVLAYHHLGEYAQALRHLKLVNSGRLVWEEAIEHLSP